MKKILLLMPALFFIIISAAHSQSLGDLAKKEQSRREGVKGEVKTILIDESAKEPESNPTDSAAKPDAEKKDDAAKADQSQSPKTDPDEAVDYEGRPESYWRKTMADARQKVKELENENNVLILKMAELQTKFYNIDDGYAREAVGKDIQKLSAEQETNKANLEKAKSELASLEKEAQKSGALPGWIGK
jgi:hypothetical protein